MPNHRSPLARVIILAFVGIYLLLVVTAAEAVRQSTAAVPATAASARGTHLPQPGTPAAAAWLLPFRLGPGDDPSVARRP